MAFVDNKYGNKKTTAGNPEDINELLRQELLRKQIEKSATVNPNITTADNINPVQSRAYDAELDGIKQEYSQPKQDATSQAYQQIVPTNEEKAISSTPEETPAWQTALKNILGNIKQSDIAGIMAGQAAGRGDVDLGTGYAGQVKRLSDREALESKNTAQGGDYSTINLMDPKDNEIHTYTYDKNSGKTVKDLGKTGLAAMFSSNPERASEVAYARETGKQQAQAGQSYKESKALMNQMNPQFDRLEELNKNSTGGIAGMAAIKAKSAANVPLTQAEQNTVEVTQNLENNLIKILKATLGAQFTEREGEWMKRIRGIGNVSPQERGIRIRGIREEANRQFMEKAELAGVSQEKSSSGSSDLKSKYGLE